MESLVIVFVSALLFHSSDAGTFTWLHSDDTVHFVEGETAKLKWNVRIGAGKTWAAVKITRRITNVGVGGEVDLIRRKPSGVLEILLAERGADMDLDVQASMNVLNVTFSLGNLSRKTDEMYYRITLIDDDIDSSSRNTKLNVDVPSSCKIHPNATTVKESGHVLLNVNTTGNPHVNNYNWTHPDGRRLAANSTLSFTASSHDTGTYKVSVYNGVGDWSYCISNVTVQYPPDRITCSNKTVQEGEDVQLVCSASGNPPPDVMWRRNGNIRGMGSTLLIKGVTRSDSGKYTVLANNSLGHETKDIFITVKCKYKVLRN